MWQTGRYLLDCHYAARCEKKKKIYLYVMTQNCVCILCLCLGAIILSKGPVYTVWLLISVTQLIICLKGITVFACNSQIPLLSETNQVQSFYCTTAVTFHFLRSEIGTLV